jgi:uncharacterized PurR-regulated membrane protein YhhQ (DUF165 family)
LEAIETDVKGDYDLTMRYLAVICYILFILTINVCYVYLPAVHIGHNELSAGDFLVGWIYLIRDFAQRRIGHWIILAMVVGAVLSFWLADPVIANASVCAFAVGEAIDWSIFSFTRKPLSQRLIWSAGISAPIDTLIFLWIANHLNGLEFTVMTLVKFLGVYTLWKYWQIRQKRHIHISLASS